MLVSVYCLVERFQTLLYRKTRFALSVPKTRGGVGFLWPAPEPLFLTIYLGVAPAPSPAGVLQSLRALTSVGRMPPGDKPQDPVLLGGTRKKLGRAGPC